MSPEPDLISAPLVISAEQVLKTYNRELIVRDFSCKIALGDRVAITGQNGSGKSTVLKMLTGMTLPDRGNITYLKEGVAVPPEKWHNLVAFCSPAQELIEEFTLREFLAFHYGLRSYRDVKDVEEFLERAYLTPHAGKKIGLFSSGMKQRLKLALALFTQAEAFFLDEPTTNMDETGTVWYLEQIQNFPEDKLLVIASNQEKEYNFCSREISIMDYKSIPDKK